MPLDVLKPL